MTRWMPSCRFSERIHPRRGRRARSVPCRQTDRSVLGVEEEPVVEHAMLVSLDRTHVAPAVAAICRQRHQKSVVRHPVEALRMLSGSEKAPHVSVGTAGPWQGKGPRPGRPRSAGGHHRLCPHRCPDPRLEQYYAPFGMPPSKARVNFTTAATKTHLARTSRD